MGNCVSRSTTTRPVILAPIENGQTTRHIPYDYIFKVCLLGLSCVGKTKLCRSISTNESVSLGEIVIDPKSKAESQQDLQSIQVSYPYVPTIGVDFGTIMWEDNKCSEKVKLQLWDTAGDQRFRSIVKSYLRGCQLFFLIYKENETDVVQTYIESLELVRYRSENSRFILMCDKPVSTSTRMDVNVDWIQGINVDYHFLFDFSNNEHFKEILDMIFPVMLTDKKFCRYISTTSVVSKKPAIYLYGEKGTNIDIELKTSALLSVEIPKRNLDGKWNCTIEENNLTINRSTHDYIYWEAIADKTVLSKFDIGYSFYLSGSDYAILYQVMSYLLNLKELRDFDEYWTEYFASKSDRIFEISFIDEASFDEHYELQTSININRARIELLFKECTDPDCVPIKSLTNIHLKLILKMYPKLRTIRRDKKGLIEWGGTIIE